MVGRHWHWTAGSTVLSAPSGEDSSLVSEVGHHGLLVAAGRDP